MDIEKEMFKKQGRYKNNHLIDDTVTRFQEYKAEVNELTECLKLVVNAPDTMKITEWEALSKRANKAMKTYPPYPPEIM